MANETGFTVVDDSKTTAQKQPEPIEIDVEPGVAFNLKLQEFDKHISEAEAQVADLKRQRATFVYETNLQAVVQASQAKKESATQPTA